ncbi:MAG: ABC transporter permease [Mucinivorans sp.]
MKKVLRQIYESFRFAIQSVTVNKMRTLLSLLGITIGIFAIISVFTVIDAMESTIRSSVDAIGTNILYVNKWPWMPEEGKEYEWWTYSSRPNVQLPESEDLASRVKSIKAQAMVVYFRRVVIQGNRSKDNVDIVGGTQDYNQMRKTVLERGRYISPAEFRSGSPVAVIGSTLAKDLFDDEDPLGRYIKIGNTRATVLGVFEREGSNMFGLSYDEQVLIPYKFSRNFVNLLYMDKDMIVRGRDDVNLAEFKAEVTAAMRQIRRLPPDVENNFQVNEVTGIMKQLDQVFATINTVGGIIGLFSILVGGFGVANIMFVSVRERTGQIGIQKALGARSYSILLEFTFEAVMLSLFGGAIGLLLIWGGAAIVSSVTEVVITLTFKNILIGLGISSFVGAVAGIFPAYMAAKLDPMAAITKA